MFLQSTGGSKQKSFRPTGALSPAPVAQPLDGGSAEVGAGESTQGDFRASFRASLRNYERFISSHVVSCCFMLFHVVSCLLVFMNIKLAYDVDKHWKHLKTIYSACIYIYQLPIILSVLGKIDIKQWWRLVLRSLVEVLNYNSKDYIFWWTELRKLQEQTTPNYDELILL